MRGGWQQQPQQAVCLTVCLTLKCFASTYERQWAGQSATPRVNVCSHLPQGTLVRRRVQDRGSALRQTCYVYTYVDHLSHVYCYPVIPVICFDAISGSKRTAAVCPSQQKQHFVCCKCQAHSPLARLHLNWYVHKTTYV